MKQAHAIPQKQQGPAQTQNTARFSSTTLVSAAMTLAVLIGILGYALIRSHGSSTGSTGLTNADSFKPNPTLLAVGQRAPNFTMVDTQGRSHTLSVQVGHPLLLEFFAVWCPNCQAEAPVMNRLNAAFAPRGVRVWNILSNPYGRNYEASGRLDLRLADKSDLSWYTSTYNVKYPQLIDPQFTGVNQYGAHSYPTIYVIDKAGIVRFAESGRRPYATLAASLNKALKAGAGD